MASAVKQRLEPDLAIATTHVESTDPLRPVEFVSRNAQQIDVVGLNIERNLADRLRGIGVEDHTAVATNPANFGDWVNRSDLVIRGHDRAEQRFVREGVGDRLGRNQSVFVTGNQGRLPALSRQPLNWVEDGPVLGDGGYQVFAAACPGTRAPLIARLFDSVAPEVNTISRASAPIARATCSRARSTASAASHPKR